MAPLWCVHTTIEPRWVRRQPPTAGDPMLGDGSPAFGAGPLVLAFAVAVSPTPVPMADAGRRLRCRERTLDRPCGDLDRQLAVASGRWVSLGRHERTGRRDDDQHGRHERRAEPDGRPAADGGRQRTARWSRRQESYEVGRGIRVDRVVERSEGVAEGCCVRMPAASCSPEPRKPAPAMSPVDLMGPR